MKNIRKIFLSDLKHLCTNFFAMVIAIGLCVLPALYAWFNIYANWDPYANTANIRIGVASLDQGYEPEGEDYINMGDEVVEQLKEADSIGWVFVDTEEEAKDGVYSGDYYAAVVIDADFTKSMYTAFSDNFENPRITYYENEKKNAVASKITDTAVSTLKQSINEQFVRVVTSKVFQTANGISGELTEESAFDAFEDRLKTINSNLINYQDMISRFVEGNAALKTAVQTSSDSIEDTHEKVSEENTYIEKATGDLDSTRASLNSFNQNVRDAMTGIQTSINNISTDIDNSGIAADGKALDASINQTIADSAQALEDIQALKDGLNTLITPEIPEGTLPEVTLPEGTLPEVSVPEITLSDAEKQAIQDTLNSAEQIQEWVEGIKQTASSALEVTAAEKTVTAAASTAKKMLSGCSQSVENVKNLYNNTLVPQMDNLLDSLDVVLGNATDLLNSLDNALGDMDTIFDGIVTTVDNTNSSLTQTGQVILAVSDKLTEITEGLDSVSKDERAEKLVEILAGDPELYGEFFSEPVQIHTNEVYPVSNYGSAVTPFYSVLAIWVGGLFLVSLFKVKADPSKLDAPKSWQLFFGRYLLFFLLGQIQTAVIVAGDIFLLGVQCLHPGMFWAAAALTSFTFTLLIYSLTLSFGDVGKAVAVVMVVIQIAGSGGTYPIELLPSFYRNVYIFFPFPYAINAIRECVGGMYENTYSVCLSELLIFAAAALLIGLVIRIPFVGLNRFVEKRMEDTEMM